MATVALSVALRERGPLDAELRVFWSAATSRGPLRRLRGGELRVLTPADACRVEIGFNRPVYPCLIRITSDGSARRIDPPGVDGADDAPAVESLTLPGAGLVPQGESGYTTLLLVARETPLPTGFRWTGALANLPAVEDSRAQEVLEYADWKPVLAAGPESRGDFDPTVVPGPASALIETLAARLGSVFPTSRALCIPTRPGPDRPGDGAASLEASLDEVGRAGVVNDAASALSIRREKPGRALLVGVTRYRHVDGVDLRGPGNDVDLIADTLVTDFGFSEDRIERLTEDSGTFPTYAAIRAGLRRLEQKAETGEWVVIFLAGHGTQVPSRSSPDDPEPDGKDEVFLPADVTRWSAATSSIPNALRDDELSTHLRGITDRGAHVWLIVDACHAGTLARSPDDREVWRFVSPDRLDIPVTRTPDPHARQRLSRGERIVATYAGQSWQRTPEALFGDRYYGVFTHALVRGLRTSGSALTYRELIDRVAASLLREGRRAPTPGVEGGLADHPLFGSTRARRSRISITGTAAGRPPRYSIGAGALHGLTAGSILAVRPPAGEADRIIGYVRVLEAGLSVVSARIEAVEYRGTQAPASLEIGSRCELVERDFGDLRLRLALQRVRGDGAVLEPISLGDIGEPLHGLLTAEATTRFVEVGVPAARAAWCLQLDRDRVRLVPARGNESLRHPLRVDLGMPGEPEFASRLELTLRRIAQAESLLALACSGALDDDGLRVDFELVDEFGDTIEYGGSGRQVAVDRAIQVRAHNRSKTAVDVNLVVVTSQYSITPLLDRAFDDDVRLASGESRGLISFRVRADSDADYGLEHLVCIATPARHRPISFEGLRQPGVVERGGDSRSASALERLMERAYQGGQTRSAVRRDELARTAISLLSWTTVPR